MDRVRRRSRMAVALTVVHFIVVALPKLSSRRVMVACRQASRAKARAEARAEGRRLSGAVGGAGLVARVINRRHEDRGAARVAVDDAGQHRGQARGLARKATMSRVVLSVDEAAVLAAGVADEPADVDGSQKPLEMASWLARLSSVLVAIVVCKY